MAFLRVRPQRRHGPGIRIDRVVVHGNESPNASLRSDVGRIDVSHVPDEAARFALRRASVDRQQGQIDAERALEVLRYAHDAKARTVAITDSPISPVARLADYVLLVRPTPPRTMASYAAIASLASALTEAVAARKGRSAGRSLRDAESLWDRFRVHARDAR